MLSSVSEDLSRLLPGPAVPGFQKVRDMLVRRKLGNWLCAHVSSSWAVHLLRPFLTLQFFFFFFLTNGGPN